MFQVIACPRCRRARVVQSGKRTTSCGSCGRDLELANLRAHHEGPDLETARHEAGLLNARLAGREVEFVAALMPPAPRAPRHDDAFAGAAATARRASSEKDRVDRIARHLAASMGEFALADLQRAMHVAGIAATRAEAHLERMLATSVLYEPRAGRYRAF